MRQVHILEVQRWAEVKGDSISASDWSQVLKSAESKSFAS